jgi:hypothetical protein
MNRGNKILLGMSLLALTTAGCANDKPHEYGDQRPDINQVDPNDSGLQSKDVEAATSQMIQQLLALPELNASPKQWTLTVSAMDDLTTEHDVGSYAIFMESLRAAISEKGQGRIRLIENKDKFHDLQNKELEGAPADPYGQGGGAAPPGGAGIQPDYILYGKAMDLPNRTTNYFNLEYSITNSHTREEVFTRIYKVKVAR